VKPAGVVLTSGGTEANNLAILGTARGLNLAGVPYARMHFITLSTEHPSVLECMRELERLGASVSYLPVNEDGLVALAALEQALVEETVLVSIAHVNSEIGVIQPLAAVARLLNARRAASSFRAHPGWQAPYLHADACQSPLYLDASPHALHADLVSLDAQKLGGPKGVGALVTGAFVPLAPVLFGGSQERRVRPGTEDVASAAAFAAALAEAVSQRAGMRRRVGAMRDFFFEELLRRFPGVRINGSRNERIANNINVSFPGLDAEYLAVALDERGIACATKSACRGAEGDGSHVVRALSDDEARAKSALRFTFGTETTRADIGRALRAIAEAVALPAARLSP
jgi:cysteine desulfurase